MDLQSKPIFQRARRLFPWFIFAGAIFALLTTPASANVELLYFTASPEQWPVLLEWETATELNNSGFFIRRSQSGGNNPNTYAQVPVIDATTQVEYPSGIPARGSGAAGDYYPFYDDNVSIGSRYYYYLEDVDTSNFSTFHGPVEVVAGQTFTPSPSPTNTSPPTNTNTPTKTSVPANTATRTPPPATATATSASSSGNPTATGTAGPTLSPTSPTNPTSSPTLDPNVTPINATLTAIALAVTELATETITSTITITSTPVAVALSASETADQAAAGHATPSPTATPAESAPSDGAFNRLALLAVIFLASGLLLTGGIIYLARLNQNAS